MTSPAQPDPLADPHVGPASAAGRTADDVATAVLGVDGVVALHGGPLGGLATYLPGRLVRGVRLTDGDVEVGVVVRFGTPITELSGRVRAAVGDLVDGAVIVTVGDVVDEAEESALADPDAEHPDGPDAGAPGPAAAPPATEESRARP